MVYCRTLPDLTFPVTEWDLDTRLREPSILPVRNLQRMWDELGKFAYERFLQVNTSPKSNKAPETRPEVFHCFC